MTKRKQKNIITFDCYDRKTNTCDGRCQGWCSCPMATNHQASRKQMWKHMKETHIRNKHLYRFEQNLSNDMKFMKNMSKVWASFLQKQKAELIDKNGNFKGD